MSLTWLLKSVMTSLDDWMTLGFTGLDQHYMTSLQPPGFFKDVAAPPTGRCLKLLHCLIKEPQSISGWLIETMNYSLQPCTTLTDTRICDITGSTWIIRLRDCPLPLIKCECFSNLVLIQPFQRLFLLSCLFLCDTVEGGLEIFDLL